MKTTYKVCKKCGVTFPRRSIVDGKKQDLGLRSYCLTCSPYGADNKRRLSQYQMIDGIENRKCPVCQQFKPLAVEFCYNNGQVIGPCKSCASQKRKQHLRTKQQQAIEYKGGKCIDCGGVFQGCVYDFHHLDPKAKDFNIGNNMKSLAWEKMKPELDKCILLCSNCHRLRHFKD